MWYYILTAMYSFAPELITLAFWAAPIIFTVYYVKRNDSDAKLRHPQPKTENHDKTPNHKRYQRRQSAINTSLGVLPLNENEAKRHAQYENQISDDSAFTDDDCLHDGAKKYPSEGEEGSQKKDNNFSSKDVKDKPTAENETQRTNLSVIPASNKTENVQKRNEYPIALSSNSNHSPTIVENQTLNSTVKDYFENHLPFTSLIAMTEFEDETDKLNEIMLAIAAALRLDFLFRYFRSKSNNVNKNWGKRTNKTKSAKGLSQVSNENDEDGNSRKPHTEIPPSQTLCRVAEYEIQYSDNEDYDFTLSVIANQIQSDIKPGLQAEIDFSAQSNEYRDNDSSNGRRSTSDTSVSCQDTSPNSASHTPSSFWVNSINGSASSNNQTAIIQTLNSTLTDCGDNEDYDFPFNEMAKQVQLDIKKRRGMLQAIWIILGLQAEKYFPSQSKEYRDNDSRDGHRSTSGTSPSWQDTSPNSVNHTTPSISVNSTNGSAPSKNKSAKCTNRQKIIQTYTPRTNKRSRPASRYHGPTLKNRNDKWKIDQTMSESSQVRPNSSSLTASSGWIDKYLGRSPLPTPTPTSTRTDHNGTSPILPNYIVISSSMSSPPSTNVPSPSTVSGSSSKSWIAKFFDNIPSSSYSNYSSYSYTSAPAPNVSYTPTFSTSYNSTSLALW